MAENKKSRSKMFALVTYIIAVVSLIAGLILPLDTAKLAGGIDFSNMPVLQAFGALSTLGLSLSFGKPVSDAFSFTVNFGGKAFNIGALLLLLYVLVTVVALILIIPVSLAKKKGRGARRIASITELVAITVLLLLAAMDIARARGSWNLSVFIPLGVTLIVLILQSFVYLGGSGFLKFVMFLLSAAAALFIVCDITVAIPAFDSAVNRLASAMSGSRPFATSAGLYHANGADYSGSRLIVDFLKTRAALTAGGWTYAVAHYIGLALVAVIALNLYLDILGLGKSTNKFMLISNISRYALQFALVVALAVTVFAVAGSFGLMLYLALILSIIQTLLQVIRFARFIHAEDKEAGIVKTKKPKKSKSKDGGEEAEEAEAADEFAEPYNYDGAPSSTPARDGNIYETRNVIYNVNTIYNGPSDSFIRKLTNEEKVEFARVFLERRVGNLSAIPDYVVGGDNKKFFSMVFIYFARVRDVVSDGLMNKLYDEVSQSN